MSFLFSRPVILSPEDLALVRGVYGRIVSEPWVSKDLEAQEQFAKYVLKMYTRGMCHPEKLFRLCLIAAKFKLSDESVTHRAKQSLSEHPQG